MPCSAIAASPTIPFFASSGLLPPSSEPLPFPLPLRYQHHQRILTSRFSCFFRVDRLAGQGRGPTNQTFLVFLVTPCPWSLVAFAGLFKAFRPAASRTSCCYRQRHSFKGVPCLCILGRFRQPLLPQLRLKHRELISWRLLSLLFVRLTFSVHRCASFSLPFFMGFWSFVPSLKIFSWGQSRLGRELQTP